MFPQFYFLEKYGTELQHRGSQPKNLKNFASLKWYFQNICPICAKYCSLTILRLISIRKHAYNFILSLNDLWLYLTEKTMLFSKWDVNASVLRRKADCTLWRLNWLTGLVGNEKPSNCNYILFQRRSPT